MLLWMLAVATNAVATEADERYERLLAMDRQLATEIAEAGPAPGIFKAAHLRARLRRLEDAYRDFVRRYPQHGRGLVAYGSFLEDLGRQQEALAWWEKALAIPHADAWTQAHALNNLANYWGHQGDPQRALRQYERAIQLLPDEPVFRFNWATMCSLYRGDAAKLYGWQEDEIFRRSLDQLRCARDLAPTDFGYAQAYAETFYLMKSADWNEAHAAWQYCLQLARDDETRNRVYAHLVRVCLNLGRRDEARMWLNQIQSPTAAGIRATLERRLSRELEATPTDPNAAP